MKKKLILVGIIVILVVVEFSGCVKKEENLGFEILVRPTNKSITISIMASTGMNAFVEYGTNPGVYNQHSKLFTSSNGEPIEITLNNLLPNTRYYYRTNYKLSNESQFKTEVEHYFITQRPQGNTFIFDVQADSHMDNHSDANVYNTTLQSEANDTPDFLIDLGDTFMTEKFAKNQEEVNSRYIDLRSFFEIPCSSSPLFLANGNHDGEFGWLFNTSNKDNDAYWAIKARKTYYPNPYPNYFYTGSSTQDPIVGLHENYYAWTWGDALFIVLDPYTYTINNPKQTGNMWDWTIGDAQYQWFKQILENSNAKYKFVFIHHIHGEERGMTTIANLYEWGGYNKNGVWEFNKMRPNWEMPIHQLMVKNNVTILFQGHDHLFCKEEKDGIVYQEVPQPSVLHGNGAPGTEGKYVGQVINSSGYLRIVVSPSNVNVSYIRTAPPELAGIAYSYNVK